ncbi:MAG: hypothetical protein KF897_09015 [Opitutaceae bacterium]|nr:hypothetical protein [Opitutaceae bacterium]
MSLNTAEIIGLCGLVVSLISIWLHWDMQYRLAAIEDRHKDGRITEGEMAKKIQFWKIFAPALTLVGVALLSVAAFGLLK